MREGTDSIEFYKAIHHWVIIISAIGGKKKQMEIDDTQNETQMTPNDTGHDF